MKTGRKPLQEDGMGLSDSLITVVHEQQRTGSRDSPDVNGFNVNVGKVPATVRSEHVAVSRQPGVETL